MTLDKLTYEKQLSLCKEHYKQEKQVHKTLSQPIFNSKLHHLRN